MSPFPKTTTSFFTQMTVSFYPNDVSFYPNDCLLLPNDRLLLPKLSFYVSFYQNRFLFQDRLLSPKTASFLPKPTSICNLLFTIDETKLEKIAIGIRG